MRWHGGFDQLGNYGGFRNMASEFFWLVWHGKFRFAWNGRKLIFGVGRTWYDGPIWFAHLGVFSVDLAA